MKLHLQLSPPASLEAPRTQRKPTDIEGFSTGSTDEEDVLDRIL